MRTILVFFLLLPCLAFGQLPNGSKFASGDGVASNSVLYWAVTNAANASSGVLRVDSGLLAASNIAAQARAGVVIVSNHVNSLEGQTGNWNEAYQYYYDWNGYIFTNISINSSNYYSGNVKFNFRSNLNWTVINGSNVIDATGGGAADGVGDTNKSYIVGMWCDYVASSSVVFSAGEGYCASAYWRNADNTLTSTVTTINNTNEVIHYAYISNSVLPTLAIYWSTNTPTFNTSYFQWMNPAATSDRAIEWALQIKNTNVLYSFITPERTIAGINRRIWKSSILFCTAMNPDGTWQTPSPRTGATVFPAFPCKGGFDLLVGDTTEQTIGVITSLETATLASGITSGDIGQALIGAITWQIEMIGISVQLGVSKQIRFYGEDNDNSVLAIYNPWVEYSR